MVTLPCNPSEIGASWYSFACDLEGVEYRFLVRWNDRDSGWYMDLSAADGTLLLAGKKLVLGLPLLFRHRLVDGPPGELMAMDTTNSGVEAGLEDLGTRVQLYYLTSDEIANG